MNQTQDSYDKLAVEYTKHIHGELAGKPFDRKMLDLLIDKVEPGSTICDTGCGPGHIARYLADKGAKTCGVDLSPAMIEQASALNPGIAFETGNMLTLENVPDNAWGGIAAFYSILHTPRENVVDALRTFWRVLKPGGAVLLTFHIGAEIRHIEDLWGVPVTLDFVFFERQEMQDYLTQAGFTLEEGIERDPYPPEIEVQTRRAYLFARKAK